jgi:hypothetical protein
MKKLPLTNEVSTNPRRLEAVRKRLEKKNEEFRKLTKSEQRVQIAQDVIAQLKAKKLVAASTYLTPQVDDVNIDSPECDDYPYIGDLDVSEVTSQVQCEVCGIGSLFVTAVERNDKLKVKKFINDDGWGSAFSNREGQVEYLRRWFPEEMLDEIEAYFEDDTRHSASPIRREWDADKRLQMIMENIISNNGKFNPEKGDHRWDRKPDPSDYEFDLRYSTDMDEDD